jgi:RNA polymerase sigma factor (sigma-70 family)
MACSYAYSLLRDAHLAQDATQEAFVQAFYDLPKLREPEAFAGWLRRIVLKQCDRLTRRKRIATVPLEEAAGVAARETGPAENAEARERHAEVMAAIGALKEHEREVILLYYIRDYSQREIADFLQIPVTTVNSRMGEARKRLRGRILTMVAKTLKEYQLPEDYRVCLKRPSATQTVAPGLAWFQGRWVMVWQDGVRGDPWDHPFWFLLSESPDGREWSEPRRLDLPPQLQQLPRLCVHGGELVMHTHDWHHGVRIARTRDLQTWSDQRLAVGVSGRGAPFVAGGALHLVYARWLEIDSIGDAVEAMVSADGATWRWLRPPLPGRGTGVLSACGAAVEDRLFAFWSEHAYADEGQPQPPADACVSWSDDAGETWSPPGQIEALSTPKEWTSPGAAAVSPDGRLVVGSSARDAQGNGELRLAVSSDRGETWLERAVFPVEGLDEVTFAFAPDGTLLLAGNSSEGAESRPVVLHTRLQGT